MKKLVMLFVVSIGISLLSSRVVAQTTNFQVYSLFVMNIAKYSVWPEDNGEFEITILGKSKVYDELLKYADRGVNGKKVKLIQTDNISEIGSPNILYLSMSKSSLIDEVLKSTDGKPVMVVTEREGLHKKGAGFSFFINESNNLRFDINNTELERRRIKVAKNLAGMAHEVL